jgi:hypothetical protein
LLAGLEVAFVVDRVFGHHAMTLCCSRLIQPARATRTTCNGDIWRPYPPRHRPSRPPQRARQGAELLSDSRRSSFRTPRHTDLVKVSHGASAVAPKRNALA